MEHFENKVKDKVKYISLLYYKNNMQWIVACCQIIFNRYDQYYALDVWSLVYLEWRIQHKEKTQVTDSSIFRLKNIVEMQIIMKTVTKILSMQLINFCKEMELLKEVERAAMSKNLFKNNNHQFVLSWLKQLYWILNKRWGNHFN